MNTQLKKLFDVYDIWEKDRYEINQIFWILSLHKQNRLINNFPILAENIRKIHRNIDIERELLLWEAIIDIKHTIEQVKQKQI